MARLFKRQGIWCIDYTNQRGDRIRKRIGTDKSVAQAALGAVIKATEKVRNGIIQTDPREA